MIIETTKLSRRYGGTVALDAIDLHVEEGEMFGLLGADGAGKTTLMQMLSAILDPTGGTARVLGFDTVRNAERIVAKIGYMPQGFSLYDRLTVSENLDFSASIRGVPPAEWRKRRDRLLAMTGLARFGERRAGQLSGGMRKKLALCTNLVHEPPLLLLDEPGLGVDPVSRRELWQLLEEFRNQGATILVATSYMDEAERCNRLLFLDQGHALAIGTPAELRERANGSVFEVLSNDLGDAEGMLRRIGTVRGLKRLPDRIRYVVEEGETLPQRTGVAMGRPVAPTLEDVFTLLENRREAMSAPAVLEQVVRPSGVAIRTKDVTCRFGTFVALDRVSLTVQAGEVFGFLGPNGAGKTTFIRVLCGLQPATLGDVEVVGIDVRRNAKGVRPHIGYMSQRFSLYPDLTVGENLSFFAGAYGLHGSNRRAAIKWATEMSGLEGTKNRCLSDVSAAIRQRVALAASLMHRPKILFLDEPTSGVDPVSRYRFWHLIRSLASLGVTVFVTTHYLEEAAYCDRLGLMFEGRLIGVGDLATLASGLARNVPQDSVEDVFLAYISRERGHAKEVSP